MERTGLRQCLNCILVLAPRIEGKRVIPMIEVGREWVHPFGHLDPFKRFSPPPPVNQNICKYGRDISVVGIERKRSIEVHLSPVVLLSKKEDLGIDATRPGVVFIDVQSWLDLSKRIVQGHAGWRFKKGLTHDCPCDIGMGARIVRVERGRGAKPFPGLSQSAPIEAPPLFISQEDKVIRSNIRSLFSNGNVSACVFQAPGQDGDNRPRYLVLYGKNVFKPALVALAPELIAAFRIDELDGDPQFVAGLADAALDNVANTKLPSNQLDVDCLAFVDEARIARDHEKRLEPGQRRDDVFDHPVGEVRMLDADARA